MEELRSTEAIDNEIRLECQRKAEKIALDAKAKSKILLEEIDSQLEEARLNAVDQMNNRIAYYESNMRSSVPLEKQRYLVSFINRKIVEAMNQYFNSCTAEQKLDFLRPYIRKAMSDFKTREFSAYCAGFTKESVAVILNDELGNMIKSVEELNSNTLLDEDVEGFDRREGIILKADDGSLVCRFTINLIVREMLESSKKQLAMALFGGRLPE